MHSHTSIANNHLPDHGAGPLDNITRSIRVALVASLFEKFFNPHRLLQVLANVPTQCVGHVTNKSDRGTSHGFGAFLILRND